VRIGPSRETISAATRRMRALLDRASPWQTLPALSALVMGLLGWVPSLAGPGYLSCLAAGLVLPTLVAVGVSRRAANTAFEPEPLVLFGTGIGLASAAAGAFTLLLQGLRVGLCDPLQDWLLYLLGPLFGTVLGGLWGTCAGSLALRYATKHRARLATVFALCGPLSGIALSLWRFYSSPMVFAFDPFVGFFAGTPYDTGFDPIERLVTYRLGSTATLLGAWLLSRQLTRTPAGGVSWRLPSDIPLRNVSAALFAISFVVCAAGKWLGHYSTTASIRERLGHSVSQGRCEIVFSGGIARPAASMLARDCDAWLGVLEKRLGVTALPAVTAFVFANVAEKEAAMGAGHTQVAKPWRREIYLNGAEFPHPVLGHELAHVVAGQTGRGPFKIAGALGGWLPNAGLIEGMAVALAPDDEGDLNADQWANALAEQHQLPPISALLGLDFLVQPGRLAYVVAGSFVASIEKNRGSSALRRWYAGESLETITGRTLAQLEANWHVEIAQASLPDSAREAARALFDRPSALVRHCPHAVDRAVSAAVDALNAQDPGRACQLVDASESLDPDELRLRQLAADCRQRSGDSAGATARWQAIADDSRLALPKRDQAREVLADRALESGQLETARAIYREIQGRTLDIDKRRTLEVKLAVDSPEGIAAVEALITGGKEGANWDRGVARLARWMAANPNDGLPRYLLGRNLLNRGQYHEARQLLEDALAKELELTLVKSEAQRLMLVLACAEGDLDRVKQQLPRVLADNAIPLPRREGIAALARRCLGDASVNAMPGAGRVPQKSKVKGETAPRAALSCPNSMALIPGGETWIGGHYNPEEAPRFKTRFAPFCLDKTEVTMSAWQECVDAGQCTAAGQGTATCNGNYRDRGNHPVNCVNYHQAEAYCAFMVARLPTEFEWEYAARGGEQALKYPWGSEAPDGHVCWKQPGTCPVKSYPAAAFGLYDISGNVWEWTSSDFGPYPFPPLPDEAALKVYRGGSWSRRFEKWMHVGLRNRFRPGDGGSHLGLRCAVTPDGVPCPFERDAEGQCLHGVLDAECEPGQVFNGLRCARPGAPECQDGMHPVPGHGCQPDVKLHFKANTLDLTVITRRRTPEFDQDCRTNQPDRSKAYRLGGGEHLARNAYAGRDHCKNRDVGVGWNSICCP